MRLRQNESCMRAARTILTLVVTAAFCRDLACGEDLAMTSGKVFKDIEITELDGDAIKVRHRDGIERILWKDLPDETRKRFSALELWKELRRKSDEIEKLRSELSAARDEAQKVVRSAELSGGHLSATVEKAGRTPAKPMMPISALPDVNASDVVPADEIAHYYSADPRSSDLRFRKKTFRVQGKIERFEERGFVRKTVVILDSPDRSLRIFCEQPFAEEFSAVFSTKGGQVLVGVTSSRREVRLMEVGEAVIFEGKCAGLQNRGIVFSQCERVK